MSRTSTATLVIGSISVGVIALALTALTRTSAGGAYAFMFLGLLVFGIVLLWPDLRLRFSDGLHLRSTKADDARHRRQARHSHG